MILSFAFRRSGVYTIWVSSAYDGFPRGKRRALGGDFLRRVIVEIIATCECALRIAGVVAVLALSALPLEAAHADEAPTLLWRRQANLKEYG